LIVHRQRFNLAISKRTRFSEGIGEQARDVQGLLLSVREEPAGPEVARALGIEPQRVALRLEALRKADRLPLSVSTSWFPLPRFSEMGEAFGKTGSITSAFALCGLSDYLRVKTE